MYWVYILQSEKDGGYYIGYTSDMDKRLRQHNSGKTRSLKHRIPLRIVYREEFNTIQQAKKRELEIKSYKGGEAFRKLINPPGSPRLRRD
jgi:putative endonuclease